jgi:type IV secretory pathway VirB10-like protein
MQTKQTLLLAAAVGSLVWACGGGKPLATNAGPAPTVEVATAQPAATPTEAPTADAPLPDAPPPSQPTPGGVDKPSPTDSNAEYSCVKARETIEKKKRRAPGGR